MAGVRPGTTTTDAQRLADLQREVRELRRANHILKTASAFFAAELVAQQREYARLFAQRQAQTSAVDQASAIAAYGGTGRLEREVRAVRAQLQRMEEADKANSDNNARQVGDRVGGALNGAAPRAHGRRGRGGLPGLL